MAFQPVEVAVTVMARDAKMLAIYNHKWGAFSLPMTKRKKWQDPQISLGVCEEDWTVTATRAAAEALGKSFAPKQFPRRLMEVKEYRQRGEDGIWKVYAFQIFGMDIPGHATLHSGTVAEWLTPAEFDTHQPLSTTARYLVHTLEKNNLLPPWP